MSGIEWLVTLIFAGLVVYILVHDYLNQENNGHLERGG